MGRCGYPARSLWGVRTVGTGFGVFGLRAIEKLNLVKKKTPTSWQTGCTLDSYDQSRPKIADHSPLASGPLLQHQLNG